MSWKNSGLDGGRKKGFIKILSIEKIFALGKESEINLKVQCVS